MSYGVVLDEDAVEDLNKLPVSIQAAVEADLRDLAASPAALSRPSHFPYQPCQSYFVEHQDEEGDRYLLTILFQYTQDEANLYVLAVAKVVV